MKYLIPLFFFFNIISGSAQEHNIDFPFSVDIMTIDGEIINSTTLSNNNQLVFIEFWHSACSPCIRFLDAVKANQNEWDEKTNCKIIAIAGQKMDEKVLKLIQEKQWPFEIYFDPEYELMREMSRYHNKNDEHFTFPTVFVFNKNWEMHEKLKNVKLKLKNDYIPSEGEKVTLDMFEVDFEYYYDLFEKWNNNHTK